MTSSSSTSPLRYVGIAATGVGVVGVGLGVIFGLKAKSKLDDSRNDPDGSGCNAQDFCGATGKALRERRPERGDDLDDRLHRGAGVLLAAGLGLVVFAPSDTKSTIASLMPLLGNGTVARLSAGRSEMRLANRLLFGALVSLVGIGCSAILGINDAKDRTDQPDGSIATGDASAADAAEDPGLTTASKVDVLPRRRRLRRHAGQGSHVRELARPSAQPGHARAGRSSRCHRYLPGNARRRRLSGQRDEGHTRAHLNKLDNVGDTITRSGVLTYGPQSNLSSFIANANLLVTASIGAGCGLEAQLESAYRFLVQPDPWESVTVSKAIASYVGYGLRADRTAQGRSCAPTRWS